MDSVSLSAEGAWLASVSRMTRSGWCSASVALSRATSRALVRTSGSVL